MKFFYNSPNKKVAVWNSSLAVLRSLALKEVCKIILRDNTGSQIEVVNKK